MNSLNERGGYRLDLGEMQVLSEMWFGMAGGVMRDLLGREIDRASDALKRAATWDDARALQGEIRALELVQSRIDLTVGRKA